MTEQLPDGEAHRGYQSLAEECVNLSLALGILSLAIWIVGVFVIPVGAGWIHLFLAAGVILLIRRVVTGRGER
jgi:hypothetical protein